MLILLLCLLAFIALCVIGAVIEVLTSARYAPHRPVPRAGRAEVVGDIGWYDEVVDHTLPPDRAVVVDRVKRIPRRT